jgi:hypothetical protein
MYWRGSLPDVPLLDYSSTPSALDIESVVRQGYDLCQDLWTKASSIIIKFDSLEIWNEGVEDRSGLVGPSHEVVITDYLDFIAMIDHCRFDIKVPETVDPDSPTSTRIQRAFDIQRTNLCVTYYCLKMVLLQRFYETGISEHLGVSGTSYSLALRRLDIASDMVRVLSEVSIESLQVNGEPCVCYDMRLEVYLLTALEVEKIRRIGVTLLELIQQSHNLALTERAKSLFFTLLDVLSRLDSRVSEELDFNRGF